LSIQYFSKPSFDEQLEGFCWFKVDVKLLVVTGGLGCQGVKKAGAKLEVGIKDCSGGALPLLGGSPKAAHHPLPS